MKYSTKYPKPSDDYIAEFNRPKVKLASKKDYMGYVVVATIGCLAAIAALIGVVFSVVIFPDIWAGMVVAFVFFFPMWCLLGWKSM